MEQIQNSKVQEIATDSRLSEGNGSMSIEADAPKVEAHIHKELEWKFNLANKELAAANE